MEEAITSMLQHMAKSHLKMANILGSKSSVGVRMAYLIDSIPNYNPGFEGLESMMTQSLEITKNVTAYLNSLADLEEAIASNLGLILKALNSLDGEE
jgi:hypothetical protein